MWKSHRLLGFFLAGEKQIQSKRLETQNPQYVFEFLKGFYLRCGVSCKVDRWVVQWFRELPSNESHCPLLERLYTIWKKKHVELQVFQKIAVKPPITSVKHCSTSFWVPWGGKMSICKCAVLLRLRALNDSISQMVTHDWWLVRDWKSFTFLGV